MSKGKNLCIYIDLKTLEELEDIRRLTGLKRGEFLRECLRGYLLYYKVSQLNKKM